MSVEYVWYFNLKFFFLFRNFNSTKCLFSGGNGFFYPLFLPVVEFFFYISFASHFPTCGKLLRYATLLRLLVSFHFVSPAF